MAKLFVLLIKRNLSTIFEAVFGKLNFWRKIDRRGPYKIVKNFWLSQNWVRNYFLAKLFVSLIKRNLSTIFEAVFGKLKFWQKIDRRRPYKLVKFLTISKWGKKIFFGKIICSTHQKKPFYNILGSFWKIEFLTENRQARTLQCSEIFVLSQNGVRNYFLAKLFVPFIKRNISSTFEAVFGKLNFWGKIDRRGPYKIVHIWYYLKMG